MFKFIYKFKPLSLNECMLEANSHNINKPLRMLSRFITRIPALALRNRAAFSSGHDHHHDYSVAINQESPWIKYKSVYLSAFRIQNLSAWKESLTRTIHYNLSTTAIPLNIFAPVHSFHFHAWSLLTLGITMIHMNPTIQPQIEAISTDKILFKQDIFILSLFL